MVSRRFRWLPLSALAAAWRADPALPPLRVLAETGAARGGARSLPEVEAILDVVLASGGRLEPAGVATYEGAVAVALPRAHARDHCRAARIDRGGLRPAAPPARRPSAADRHRRRLGVLRSG